MRLKELRLSRSLYQKDIASFLGIDRTTYVKYENGTSEPPIDTLLRLCEYYHVSMDDLLGTNTSDGIHESLSPHEQEIVNIMRQLNAEGQSKLLDYADDLVSTGKYIKESQSRLVSDS